jgi:uncharacterized protein (DUF934 family)
MVLIRNGRPSEDDLRQLGDDEEMPSNAPVMVSLARWQQDRDDLRQRGAPLGLRLGKGESPALVAEDLERFDVIALEFPKFTDGRAYSYARLLRQRYGFKGEIRAVGKVLRDQFLFMQRCGFDAFEVADEKAAAAWQDALAEIGVYYQSAADDRVPAMQLRHRQDDDATEDSGHE